MNKVKEVLRKIRNILIGLIVLMILIVGGFAAAVKFDLLSTEDVAMLNEELGLYRLPFVGNGRYFEVPEGVKWPPPPEPEPKPEPKPEEQKPEVIEPPKEEPKPKEEKPKEVKIDKKAIDEQRAQREAEEKKRLARLARIYESMRPQEAANALINVDWDTTVLIFQRMSEDSVAQILAKMEPEAAAQLTEMLYAGTQRRVTTPYDTMRNEPVTTTEQLLGTE
ncbi:MAG: magnesium transporter MgtE [Selenomonadaceae bacterium]|nr:magnesium transporter MgtE [Selenomonadaceae bacterium]